MKSTGNAGLCLQLFSPDLCVGFLFLVVHSRLPPPACLLLPPPASSSQLVQTQLAHTQLAHTQLTHTHTQLVHTQLTHTHTTCTHTHNLLTHNLLTHTTCPHTTYPHTQLAPLCEAGVALMALDWLWWRAWVPVDAAVAAAVCVAGLALGDICLHSLCVAGLALGDIDLQFAWQAWRLWHWTGSGGALGSQWTPRSPRLFALLGVALGDICLAFAWQAWRLATSTHFAWQVWHLACNSWCWHAGLGYIRTYVHTYIRT